MTQELKAKLLLKSIKYKPIIAIIIAVALASLRLIVAPTGGTENPDDASIF
ncbi:MAG: hypothetical protein QXZ41_03585 [Ignisphaera sp.]